MVVTIYVMSVIMYVSELTIYVVNELKHAVFEVKTRYLWLIVNTICL